MRGIHGAGLGNVGNFHNAGGAGQASEEIPYVQATEETDRALITTDDFVLSYNPAGLVVCFGVEFPVWPPSQLGYACDIGVTGDATTNGVVGPYFNSSGHVGWRFPTTGQDNYAYIDLSGVISADQKIWVAWVWDGDGGLGGSGDEEYLRLYIDGVQQSLTYMGTISPGQSQKPTKYGVLNAQREHTARWLVVEDNSEGWPLLEAQVSEFRVYNHKEAELAFPDYETILASLYNDGRGNSETVNGVSGHETLWLEYLFAGLSNPLYTTEIVDTGPNGIDSVIIEGVESGGYPTPANAPLYLDTLGKLHEDWDVKLKYDVPYMGDPPGGGLAAFTLAAWIIGKEELPDTYYWMPSYYDTANDPFSYHYVATYDTDKVRLACRVGDGSSNSNRVMTDITTLWAINKPIFYVVRWDSSEAAETDRLKIYVNGQQITGDDLVWDYNSDKAGVGIPNTPLDFGSAIDPYEGQLRINYYATTGSPAEGGRYGQIRVFSEALSDEMIAALYNNGRGLPASQNGETGYDEMRLELLFAAQSGEDIADTSQSGLTENMGGAEGNIGWGGAYKLWDQG